MLVFPDPPGPYILTLWQVLAQSGGHGSISVSRSHSNVDFFPTKFVNLSGSGDVTRNFGKRRPWVGEACGSIACVLAILYTVKWCSCIGKQFVYLDNELPVFCLVVIRLNQ
jgi:hypothetical protein